MVLPFIMARRKLLAAEEAGFGAHRYWRINITNREGSTNASSLTEIEMRNAAGGPDLTGSGTASANAETGTGPASNAFDNNAGTIWATPTPTNLPNWIKYDFGAGNDVEINEITIRAIYTGATMSKANAQTAPEDFTLEYSDDDSVWTEAFSVTGEVNWGIGQTRTYNSTGNVGGVKRLWRINVTSNNSGNVTEIREIEMRIVASGADQTGSGQPFSSDTFGNTTLDVEAFDNNTSNAWVSPNTALPHWIGYDFGVGVSKDIVEVTIRANSANTAPKDFDIEYSNDGGTTWTTAWSVTGQIGWSAGEVRTFTKP